MLLVKCLGAHMVAEFVDQREHGDAHSEFQDWRRTHPGGYFLTLTAKSEARLHATLCVHSGNVEWSSEDTGHSLTKRRKVCASDEAVLTEWARKNGVSVSRCQSCLKHQVRETHAESVPNPIGRDSGTLGATAPHGEVLAFSWGYWGWGNAVPQFLAAAEAAEAARGYRAPVFADVRLRRAVRAIGFRDTAFEQAVGSDRYHWLRGLGNARIESHEGGVEVKQPEDVERLLDLVIKEAGRRRRVIFFCACATDGDLLCHRHTVAGLLLDAARTRHMSLTVVEWPGGEPIERVVDVDAMQWKRAKSASIPLGPEIPPAGLATLPWGSTVRLRLGLADQCILTGPVHFSGQWRLPVIATGEQFGGNIRSLKAEARRFRRVHSCNSRYSSPGNPVADRQ